MNLNTWAAVVSAFIALAGFLLDHWQATSEFFLTHIWQRLFLNLWYIWLALAAYGLYRFVQFLRELRRRVKTAETLITSLTNDSELRDSALLDELKKSVKALNEMIGEEKKVRTSQDQSLSERLNHLESKELARKLEQVEAEVKKLAALKPKPLPTGTAADLLRPSSHDL